MSSAATSPAAAPCPRGFHRFWRALRQLFLEIAGALFALLGLAWLNAALRSWNRDVAHWLIVSAIGFSLLFFFFAVTSFHRARRL
jgi:hypothetical protein